MASAGLHLGAFGDDVARLQQALAQRGHPVPAQEVGRRFFGPGTRDALLAFQKRQRLDPTGAVDAKTTAALSAPAPPATAASRVSATRALLAPVQTATPPASGSNVAPAIAGGLLSGIDLSNLPVFQSTPPTLDACGDPLPLPFAPDQQILQLDIAPAAVTELAFGPANAGPGIVTVEMYQTLVPPPAPALGLARIAGTGLAGGAGTLGGSGAVVGLARPPIGPGGPGDGTPPGGGALPQGAFQIEVLPATTGAGAIASGPAPLQFTLPPPPPGPQLPPLALPNFPRPNWRLRITNTTTVHATGRAFVSFVGDRPILNKTLDLDALNHLLCRVVSGSAPITVSLDNSLTNLGGNFNIETTKLVLLPDQDMQRQFGVHELDLGMKIIDRRYESAPLRVKLVVNDGRLALKTRIDFPYGATMLIANLVHGLVAQAIGPAGGSNIVEAAVKGGLKALENGVADALADMLLGKSEALIKTLSADIMFTMRDGSLSPLEGINASCDILVRPFIELDGIPRTLTLLVATLVEGFVGRAYDFGNPAYDSLAKLRKIAQTIHDTLGHYLLGRDQFEITRHSAPQIGLSYAGDRPTGPVLTQDDGAAPDAPLPDPGLLTNIDHIVVLMMENRSFDHVLGHLSLPVSLGGLGRSGVSGLHGTEFNLQHGGSRAYVFPFTRPPATLFGFDPAHSFSYQKIQRGGQKLRLPGQSSPKPRGGDFDIDEDYQPPPDEVTVPPMGGFVLAHARRLAEKYSAAELADSSRNYGNVATDIMGYHLAADVPIYSFLAQNYLICDRWYAPHPGDTWPNRFITLTGNLAPKPPHDPHAGFPETGTPNPQDFTPVHVKNIFDHLDAGGVTWRYYEHDLCMLRLFADYTLGHPNIVQIDDPVQGLEVAARAGSLPSVVFIDPDLTDIPAGNDDHPPTDIARGQRLVKRVYDAIANGPQWEKTLLIITYDEYGGFYDHVLPREVSDPTDPEYVSPMFNDPQFPEDAPPGQFNPQPVHYRGVRVPAFIVSPWVQAGGVSHLTFDHTSILKTIVTRFLHDNPPHLGERVSRANGLEQVLSAPRPAVGTVSGAGAVAARVARAAALSPRLAPAPAAAAAPGIAPGHGADDFRSLISAVRDRFGLKPGKGGS